MNVNILILVCLCSLVLATKKRSRGEARKEAASRRKSFVSSLLGDRKPKEHKRLRRPAFGLKVKCSEDEKNYPYRTPDGTCNNLKSPYWGQAGVPYIRMVDNAYENKKSIPRQHSSVDKSELLPSPRQVCQSVIDGNMNIPSDCRSMMVMQWGQFLDHDLGSTPVTAASNLCCENINQDSYSTDDVCFPIYIPKGDSYFDKSCMEFRRSLAYGDDSSAKDEKDRSERYGYRKRPQPPPPSRRREQFNSITSFIDASMVYGSSDAEMQSLRTGVDGLLATSSGDLLPKDDDPNACASGDFCFLAGDARVNVIPGLTALHTIFVRYHNRVAKDLKILNLLRADQSSETAKLLEHFFNGSPDDLKDEELFQTARKIVSAVIQKITYKDFLPVILGSHTMRRYGLNALYEYNSETNPTLINAFTTAAYRFGHSLIPKSMNIDNTEYSMHELFFRTNAVINNFQDVVENLLNKSCQKRDTAVAEEMSDKLFETSKGSLDIVSLNIQRGRDHGLPPFNKYRAACDLYPFKTFDDFGEHCRKSLSDIYKHPDDVDLFVGGLCEQSLCDGMLGETFACIIGKQFHNLRFGDRFYYENGDSTTGFTEKQQDLINKISLSKLLCDHGNIDEVQPNAFYTADEPGNKKISCKEIHNL